MSDYQKRNLWPGDLQEMNDVAPGEVNGMVYSHGLSVSAERELVVKRITNENVDMKPQGVKHEVLAMTLPTDSAQRKEYPLLNGCVKYFPAALVGVSKVSKLGNDKHNPGQPLHHARGKSADHGDCIMRHLVDTEDLLAMKASPEKILLEASQLAWRALAYSQEIHEQFGSPLAPGAIKCKS